MLFTAAPSQRHDHTPVTSCVSPPTMGKKREALSSICCSPSAGRSFPKRNVPSSVNAFAHAAASMESEHDSVTDPCYPCCRFTSLRSPVAHSNEAGERAIEDTHGLRRQVHGQEAVCLEQVVFAAFVDDPNVPVLLRLLVGKDPIDLVQFEGCRIAGVVDADRETRSCRPRHD